MNRIVTIGTGVVAGAAVLAGCGSPTNPEAYVSNPQDLRTEVDRQFAFIVDGNPATTASATELPGADFDFSSDRGESPYSNPTRAWGGEARLLEQFGIELETNDSISADDARLAAQIICVYAASDSALDPTSIDNIVDAEERIVSLGENDPVTVAATRATRAQKINCENGLIAQE